MYTTYSLNYTTKVHICSPVTFSKAVSLAILLVFENYLSILYPMRGICSEFGQLKYNRALVPKASIQGRYRKHPIFVHKTFEMLLKCLQRTLNKHIVRLPMVTRKSTQRGLQESNLIISFNWDIVTSSVDNDPHEKCTVFSKENSLSSDINIKI